MARRAFLLLGAACSVLAAIGPASAEVVLDGSLGPGGPLAGPDFRIEAGLGRQEGGNLFHSFQAFDLATGERATFSGPASVARVIGRVTGGRPSAIDGAIRSTIPGADVYLINPAGIAIGQGATLDVSGSFFATTADRLLLGDGGRFEARDPGASVLTAAPPAAFGFLAERPAGITLRGPALGVRTGGRIVLEGGDLKVEDAFLGAPSGGIHLKATGAVEIERSTLDAGGTGGRIRVEGGRIVLRDSLAFARTEGAGQGGAIDLAAAEGIVLDGGFLSVGSLASGPAGSVSLTAPTVDLANAAQVDAGGYADGAAGTVSVRAGRSVSLSGLSRAGLPFRSAIFADANAGPGGSVSVVAPELSLRDGARIDVGSYGPGAGGRIEVEAGTLALERGGRLFAGTEAQGPAGSVRVRATSVTIAGADEASPRPRLDRSGIYVTSGQFVGSDPLGDAGRVEVEAGSLTVADGGRIRADAFGAGRSGGVDLRVGTLLLEGGGQVSSSGFGDGAGRGGDIVVVATEAVAAVGFEADDPEQFRSGVFNDAIGGSDAGSVSISAPLFVLNGGRVTVDTTGPGRAGTVAVRAGRVVLRNEGQVFAGTDGAGAGGDIDVEAGLLEITGTGDAPSSTPAQGGAATGLFANVKERGSGGGGAIRVAAGEVAIANGGAIATRTSGSGPAGDIAVDVRGTLRLRDGRIDSAVVEAGPDAAAATPGTAGGRISISAGDLDLGPGGTVQSRGLRGPGRAGDVVLDIRRGLTMEGAAITTESREGDGGNITIRAGRLLDLNRSTIATSVAGGEGRGGNIDIDPPFVVLDRSRIEANAFGGPGGNIRISAGRFVATPDAVVRASSTRSIDGTVEIAAPELDIGGALAVLPERFLDARDLLRDACAGRGARPGSSLVEGGRGGLPPDPAGRLPSPFPGAAGRAEGDAGGDAAAPARGLRFAAACAR